MNVWVWFPLPALGVWSNHPAVLMPCSARFPLSLTSSVDYRLSFAGFKWWTGLNRSMCPTQGTLRTWWPWVWAMARAWAWRRWPKARAAGRASPCRGEESPHSPSASTPPGTRWVDAVNTSLVPPPPQWLSAHRAHVGSSSSFRSFSMLGPFWNDSEMNDSYHHKCHRA